MATDKQTLEILQALARLETQFENTRNDVSERYLQIEKSVTEKFDHLSRRLDTIQRTLDGSDGHIGLVGRVDRLEVSQRSRSKLAWITATAAIGALIAMVAEVFKK